MTKQARTKEHLNELSDDQLRALSDDEFWDAIEPEGVCPNCDARLAAEARRRNAQGDALRDKGLHRTDKDKR